MPPKPAAAAAAAAPAAAPTIPAAADRAHSPPPLEAEGVHDPEVDNYHAELEEYLTNLNEEQALAYKVAYECLEHSYTIVRSQGFLSWLDKRKMA